LLTHFSTASFERPRVVCPCSTIRRAPVSSRPVVEGNVHLQHFPGEGEGASASQIARASIPQNDDACTTMGEW